MMKRRFLSVLTPVLAGVLLSSCEPPRGSGAAGPVAYRAAASGWSIAALPQRWSIRGFDEDKDLSGIASWDGVHCLICSDELRYIQSGIISGSTVTAQQRIPLLGNDGTDTELDAEGVAVARSEGCYYVTGSHGVGKKSGKLQPSRLHVLRVPVNAATGQPDGGRIQSASLMPWVRSHPVLGRYAGQSLQANGFNIEGLTWKGGKLWFGVRAPNEGGDAFVIEADTGALFEGSPQAVLHRLPVGPGLGIREIAALNDGFLIVTGTAASDVGSDDAFAFFHWRPGAAPVFIGEVPGPSGKAEGLYILGESGGQIDVLVVFDGASGGGPRAYRLTRP